jgi:hypothetical protein
MRYDFKANEWPSDPNEAAVRNGDVFYALARRGVAHRLALMVAEWLERGDTIEGLEVELVFARGELEAQMSALGVDAIWKGGEPRKPFTVDLRKLKPQPWTRAIRNALKNGGGQRTKQTTARPSLAT